MTQTLDRPMPESFTPRAVAELDAWYAKQAAKTNKPKEAER